MKPYHLTPKRDAKRALKEKMGAMPKLRVRPVKQTAKEKKTAKLMEEIVNHEYEKHHEFVEAIQRARFYIEQCYGIKTEDQPWDLVIQAYVIGVAEKPKELWIDKHTPKEQRVVFRKINQIIKFLKGGEK